MSTETYEKINAKDKPVAEDFVYVYSEIEDGGFRKVSKAMLKVLLGVATKLSELENDKEFITKTVSDLENYYLKSDTYSKDEIDNRISLIPRFNVQVVSSLPTTDISETTVYLVSSGDDSDNLYTEYINVNGLWEILGTQKIASVENAVLYTAQTLTEEQQAQARTNISAASAEEVGQLREQIADYKGKGYYMHLSFDDITMCISNLINKTYASIWEEPFFGWLKELHEQYGAKFSLYMYNISNLKNVPTTYKEELLEASEWLKFGLHANSSSGSYASSTYLQGQTDWNTVVSQVIRFAGSHKSIDRVPRLHNFAGSVEALKGMRDCECGALGFLSTDDSRKAYYLSDEQNEFLRTHDHIIDFVNGLLFYQTDFRGDWFQSGFSSANTYDAPTKDSVYDELVYRLAISKYADTFKSYIWFCHEWQVYNGTSFTTYKEWVEDACRFTHDYGLAFDFPQNRIDINPTSYQFLSVSSGDTGNGDDSGGGEVTENVITYNGNEANAWVNANQITEITDVSEYTLESGYTVSGGNTLAYGGVPIASVGRATSITQVISGDLDGKGVGLSRYELSNGTSLSYSIWYGYLDSDNIYNGNSYIDSNNDYTARVWHTEDKVLPINLYNTATRILLIAFKRGNGSVDFTESELEEIKTLITIREPETT